MKPAWRWIAALSILSLAAFFTPSILVSIFTFGEGFDGHLRALTFYERTVHSLMVAWLLVFVGMCIRHRWKALWCLPLTSLLYIAQIRPRFWAWS